jgi:ankyrin repeat protein
MNTLPIEIIQDIANRLSVEQYRAFRTVNRRCSLIDVTPYLEFTRYKQLSEECEYTYKKCIEIGRTVSPPFKLQMSELTVSQFQFLTLNGHQAEFFRSLTCSPRSILSREVKKKALVYLLTTEVPCEHMILIFMVTDPICHNIVHHRNIRHGKVIGRGVHWAAIRGYDTLMGLILETMYDVTVSGSGGMNALHFASACGRDKVVERLLKDGRILPDVKTTTGYSSSYFAIKNEHPGCLKSLLIDPRSDLSIVICPDGYRAIDFACIGGHSKSLEVILGLNCWRIDPNMTAPGRQATPFRLAVESNRLEIVRMLLSDKRVNSKLLDARGFTVFHYAITHGSNEMVTCLLDHPAVDPNYCATDGRHAFQLPIPLEMTRLLLDHYRIDPNMMDDSGYTIFHRAIMSRKPELVKLLISHARVNCSIRTRNGRHGLDLAAKDPTMLRLLLDSETTTDPNDLDNNGFTALHRAIKKGGVNRVEMLLSFDGVNPNKLAHDGRHALFMATNAAVLKLLLDDEKITTPNMIDGVGYTVLHRAAMSNDIKRLEMLLSHKRVDPNLNARDGRHVLGLLTNAEPLKLLLDCGKINPPYMVDINVRSIFHRAVISNDMTLLKLLLSHKKVDPNLLVRDGIQSLGIYIKPETLGLSEDNGSIELEYDNNGYNLFHRAVINDEKALIMMLLLCPRYQLNVLAFSGKHAFDLASSPETVTLLLSSAQIEVNLMDDNGLTFFHRTIINSKNQVLEVLLSHERINPNLLTGTKTHALDLATTPETFSLLLHNSRIDVNVMDRALRVLLSHERINPNIE